MAKVNGIVLWTGDSVIDGAPIMLVATGLAKGSSNAKTGDLIQTWIMRRDIAPHHAIHTGADSSICGACVHRGEIVNGRNVNRSCYVMTFQAPRSIHAAFVRGVYDVATPEHGAALLADRAVRLGAYGDPAAIPFGVWESALQFASAGTGYTHQWKHCDPAFSRYCMASVDDASEAFLARAMGYRTFRVGTLADGKARGEFLCPASAQAGKILDCASCRACGGTSAKNKAHVFIPAHGRGARHVS